MSRRDATRFSACAVGEGGGTSYRYGRRVEAEVRRDGGGTWVRTLAYVSEDGAPWVRFEAISGDSLVSRILYDGPLGDAAEEPASRAYLDRRLLEDDTP